MNPFLNKDVLWYITRDVRSDLINLDVAIEKLIKIAHSGKGKIEFHYNEFKYVINKHEYQKYFRHNSTSFIVVSSDAKDTKHHHQASILQSQQEDEEKTMLIICTALTSTYKKLGRIGKKIFLDKFYYLIPTTKIISSYNLSNRSYYSELDNIKKIISKKMGWTSKSKEREAVVKLYDKLVSVLSDAHSKKACQQYLKSNLIKWDFEDSL
ncbi:hypothetical protein [Erysipelothrix rhusiopathiae]|uniref:hypothetical protein n=1 Tax=Erysipelothrix rhusiopathiae TaxID=1648 RepID=UPI003BF5399D